MGEPHGIFAIDLFMNFISVQDANAWWWEKKEVDCTATLGVTLGADTPVEVTFEQSWEGKKNVCRDGDSSCWGSDCR